MADSLDGPPANGFEAKPKVNGRSNLTAVDEDTKKKDGSDGHKVPGLQTTSDEGDRDFQPSRGLTSAEAAELLEKWGRNELEDKRTPKWLIFLKQFIAPMPIMIWIAIIVEAAIQNWADFGILLGIQFINATLGWYETTKAGDAVAALKASLKPQATVQRDGKWQTADASGLVPGDLVLLAAGAAVPADCLVNEGQIQVDQSALTGESLPVTIYKAGSVKMGSNVTRGEVEATVECTGKNTFFGKTATMLQSVDGLGNLQKVLLRVMVTLLVISFVLCGTCLIYLLVEGESFKESLSFTVVLLVASIPIAIEIVCTTTLAIGSRKLSQHGAIVTRLTAIEEMAGMNMLCSDKTGTLTLNKMVIQDDCPTYQEGHDRASVLRLGALAAKWREPPKDALDTMILGAADLQALEEFEMIDHMPFDPTVKRTESTVKGPDGVTFKVTKGAPHILLKLVSNKDKIQQQFEAKVMELGLRGIRALAIAKSSKQLETGEDDWEMVGMLTFLDPPRPDTKYTIERAHEFGVDVKMITGDHLLIAKETSRVLGLGLNILGAELLPTMDADGKVPPGLGEKYGNLILGADGFAQVYPEHKFLIVEALRQNGFAVGMTGDGVNDAPALKRADVGVAVSGATDAARAAADIVLTEPGLSVIVEAIIVARCIFQRVYNFFNYRIAATLQLLVFFFIALLALHPNNYTPNPEDAHIEDAWPEFFKMPVLLLMLITLLNDGTLISIAYDHVVPSMRPEKWNLKVLFCVSTILGAVACGSSLLLLWLMLDSNSPDSVFAKLGLPGMRYGQVITAVYLKVSVSDFLTLFAARSHSFFFMNRPSIILMCGATFALALSTILACVWPEGTLDGIPIEGLTQGDYKLYVLWVWLYCIVWWLVQDLFKVAGYWLIYKFNIFGGASSKLVNVREAHTFDDSKHPAAMATAGVVESKLLEKAVDNVEQNIDQLARKSQSPELARASQNMQLMRQSLRIARTSLQRASIGSGGRGPAVAADMSAVDEVVERVSQVAHIQEITEDQRAGLEAQLARIKKASMDLSRISGAMDRSRMQPPKGTL